MVMFAKNPFGSSSTELLYQVQRSMRVHPYERRSRGGQRKDWLATIKEWTDLNNLDLKERSLKETNHVELFFMFYFSNYK